MNEESRAEEENIEFHSSRVSTTDSNEDDHDIT